MGLTPGINNYLNNNKKVKVSLIIDNSQVSLYDFNNQLRRQLGTIGRLG